MIYLLIVTITFLGAYTGDYKAVEEEYYITDTIEQAQDIFTKIWEGYQDKYNTYSVTYKFIKIDVDEKIANEIEPYTENIKIE